MFELETAFQILLPMTLALMMLALGMSLQVSDFVHVVKKPKAFTIGFTLQLFLLPIITWIHLYVAGLFTEIPQNIMIGFIILAGCAGGATSNIISHLAGGDGALSVSLTAIVSVLTPLILPLSLTLQFNVINANLTATDLPIFDTVVKLLVITCVPVFLGMLLRQAFFAQVIRHQPNIQRLVSFLFLLLIGFMVWVNQTQLFDIGGLIIVMALSICISGMAIAAWITKKAKLSLKHQRTVMIEVGMQNAGTGIFIAAVILQKPELAIIPLCYGVVMNIPVIALVMTKE